MSKQIRLTANRRTGTGRSATTKVRDTGFVPAVIYGLQEAPANLQVPRREISAILAHAIGENVLVDVVIAEEGGAETIKPALIQEVQHHPVTGAILHLDLRSVSMTELITASIPVEPIGESDGVKNFGGNLDQLLHEIEVECLPKDLPEIIHVDVTALAIGDSVHIGGLVLPAGVTATMDPEITVIMISAPRVEVAETTAAAAPAAPEVIKEKKEPAAAEAKK